MLKSDDRVVMISGASRGIGLAVARRLAREGFRLSLGVRDEAAVASLGEELGRERVGVFRFDALDKTTHARWVDATAERFGRVDALINNAGVSSNMTIEDDDEAELDRLWAINVKAPLSLIRLALPHLKASGSGRIINVASLSGKRVRNDHVAYSMTKFAVMALTHAARRLGWDHGIRATALCPGFVATDMTVDVTKVPREQMIEATDLAEVVVTLLALPNNAAIAELLVNCRFEDAI